MARSAGTSRQLVGKDGGMALLRLPCGEMRRVPLECRADRRRAVGNAEHQNESGGKAGRTRWLGNRPKVRGIVMNPVDHPHGGGEGKTKGGRTRSRPGARPTLGYRTRNTKKSSAQLHRARPQAREG